MRLFYERHAYVLDKLPGNHHIFFVVVLSLLVQLKFQVRPQALEDIQNETNGPGNDVEDINFIIWLALKALFFFLSKHTRVKSVKLKRDEYALSEVKDFF